MGTRARQPQLFDGHFKILIFDHWLPPEILEIYSTSIPPFSIPLYHLTPMVQSMIKTHNFRLKEHDTLMYSYVYSILVFNTKLRMVYPVVGRKTRVASRVHSRSRLAKSGSGARGPSVILYRMSVLPNSSLSMCSSFDQGCWYEYTSHGMF